MKTAYTYTTLRYVHDVASGESLNVGVALHAPSANFVGARIQENFGRLKKAFPALDGDAHRRLMCFLQSRFDTMQGRLDGELAFGPDYKDISSIVTEVLPHDDSSLRWSEMGGGLTSDPAKELEHLYLRMVLANDSAKAGKGRDDDIVWSQFRAPLAREHVLAHLAPHKVIAQNDEVEFEHAWKNNQWHCLQPLSLDLLDPDKIKGKAHRLLGQMIGVRQQMERDHLYLMVGESQLDKCKNASIRALNLLTQNLPLHTVIVKEDEADSFSRTFAAQIKAHEAHVALRKRSTDA